MEELPKKLYLIDPGYRSYETSKGTYCEKFKNVFISETCKDDTPHYWMDCRITKGTEYIDMQVATIMANSLEMASIGVDICAWITKLEVTHGIEDEKIASLCKEFLTLARPKI